MTLCNQIIDEFSYLDQKSHLEFGEHKLNSLYHNEALSYMDVASEMSYQQNTAKSFLFGNINQLSYNSNDEATSQFDD